MGCHSVQGVRGSTEYAGDLFVVHDREIIELFTAAKKCEEIQIHLGDPELHRIGYLRLVSRTAPSVVEPPARTKWLPSGDQFKEKMSPSLKSVNGGGGPPQSG